LFRKPLPELERINVSGESFFYYLGIYRKQIEDNPAVLRELLGSCADRVLFCGEKPEASVYFKRIRVEGFLQTALINTARELLKSRCADNSRLRLCFIDKKGEYAEYLPTFSEYAGEITVVTDEPSAYVEICDRLYGEYGLSVIVGKSAGTLSSYDFTVSPQFNLYKLFNNTVIIKNPSTGMLDVFRGHELKIPEKVKAAAPQGVNKLEFVYALYKYCRIESLGELVFSDFKAIDSVK
jgi:hypothetical protein